MKLYVCTNTPLSYTLHVMHEFSADKQQIFLMFRNTDVLIF